MKNDFVCMRTQNIFVLGSSYWDIMFIGMVSRTYQSLVAVTSISRLQGVIMYEILLCVHDNSINICPRLSMLGYNVYHDDILDVSNLGGGDLNFKVAGGDYV